MIESEAPLERDAVPKQSPSVGMATVLRSVLVLFVVVFLRWWRAARRRR